MLKRLALRRCRLPFLMIPLVLLAAANARADLQDHAQLFGPQATDAAQAAMRQMEQVFGGKGLVIETFAAVPPEQQAALQQAGKPAFFRDWMAARAKALEVNGVYVLICMDPKYVTVGAGANTRTRGIFTAADVDHLRMQLQADLHDKRYDAGLTSAVATVHDAYAAHLNDNAPAKPPVNAPAEPAGP